MTTLYLDCETLPLGTLAHIAAGLTLDDPPAGWAAPAYPEPPVFDWRPGGNLKKAETIEAHRQAAHADHLEALRTHEAGRIEWPRIAARAEWDARRAWSLRASRAELACVAYAIDGEAVCVVDEATAIAHLVDILDDYPRIDLVAWNAGFDAAMLMVAAHRHKRPDLAGRLARYPYQVVAQRKLYGGPAWLDCADLWPVVRGDGEGSQETVARVLGVAREHPIRGNEVFDAVVSGRIFDVREHNRADLEELRDIHRILWRAAEVRRG